MFAEVKQVKIEVEHFTVTINCVGVEVSWLHSALDHCACGKDFRPDARTFLAGVAAQIDKQCEIIKEAKP